MKFKINCIPPKTTHQSSLRVFKNGSRYTVARNSKGLKLQQELMTLLLPFQPDIPLVGALKLSVVWVYPYRKNEPLKNRKKDIPCITKPDCDNLAKGFIDCLTRLNFFQDDAQIAELNFRKYWGAENGIYVELDNI